MKFSREDYARISAALKAAREQRGWNPTEAARAAGIQYPTYMRAEAGQPVQPNTLRAIEAAYRWPKNYLSLVAKGRAPDGSLAELAAEPVSGVPEPDSADVDLRDAFEQSLAFARAARAAGADDDDVREFRKLAYDLLVESMRPTQSGESPSS